MIFDEWKLEDALVVEREEGWKEGWNMVLELMEEGYTPEEIRARLAASKPLRAGNFSTLRQGEST